MYQDIICQNTKKKPEDILSIMSNLQSNCFLKVDFQKVDQHAGGKWLIHDTEDVCGSTKKHWWRKETWWWNMAVDSAFKEKQRCWKTWKKCISKEEYQKNKCLAKRAVYLAKSLAKQEVHKLGLFTRQHWPFPPYQPNETKKPGCPRWETFPQWFWRVVPPDSLTEVHPVEA